LNGSKFSHVKQFYRAKYLRRELKVLEKEFMA
jgi:hypothetical protein